MQEEEHFSTQSLEEEVKGLYNVNDEEKLRAKYRATWSKSQPDLRNVKFTAPAATNGDREN